MADLNLFLLQLVTGLALGSVFVLLAVGLSVIFSMQTVVNFAHGAYFMVGAYVGVYLLGLTGNFWISLALVPLVVGAAGLLTERVLIRPLYGRGIDPPLLLTFGLSYVLIDVIRMIFGIDGLPMGTPAALRGAVDIGVGHFPLYRLFLIGATVVIVGGLWLFIEKTRYGLIIRAGARDSEIVRVLGIDVTKLWLLVFGLGTALAGLSGILAAPIRAGGGVRGHRDRRHGFARRRRGGGARGGRGLQPHLALRPGLCRDLDFRADGAGAGGAAAGPVRPRRADGLTIDNRQLPRIRLAPPRRRGGAVPDRVSLGLAL